MLRFVKWAVIPAVVCLATTFGTASEAEAADWGISVNSGYGGRYCAPSYSSYYGSYGYYGAAPVRVYRYPVYYPSSSFYFSYGGGHRGHHNSHHGGHH